MQLIVGMRTLSRMACEWETQLGLSMLALQVPANQRMLHACKMGVVVRNRNITSEFWCVECGIPHLGPSDDWGGWLKTPGRLRSRTIMASMASMAQYGRPGIQELGGLCPSVTLSQPVGCVQSDVWYSLTTFPIRQAATSDVAGWPVAQCLMEALDPYPRSHTYQQHVVMVAQRRIDGSPRRHVRPFARLNSQIPPPDTSEAPE